MLLYQSCGGVGGAVPYSCTVLNKKNRSVQAPPIYFFVLGGRASRCRGFPRSRSCGVRRCGVRSGAAAPPWRGCCRDGALQQQQPATAAAWQHLPFAAVGRSLLQDVRHQRTSFAAALTSLAVGCPLLSDILCCGTFAISGRQRTTLAAVAGCCCCKVSACRGQVRYAECSLILLETIRTMSCGQLMCTIMVCICGVVQCAVLPPCLM